MSIVNQTKKILINKTSDQLRVALVEGQKLYDLEIEHTDIEQKVDRIYNAEVISLEPSLEAAFVDFGAKRNGFLPLKEIANEYYKPEQLKERRQIGVKDVLFEGQKILTQVSKEERGTKGAALSTYISLAGCYLVLMPNNPKASGISRRIEGEERDELRNTIAQLEVPEGMGVIVRTAGIGKSVEELQWDLDVLLKLWESIKQVSQAHGAPYFIHQESDVTTRAIRDHFRRDINEILIDDEEIYQKVHAFVERVWPNYVHRVKLYQDPVPLFSRYHIEKQIESVFQRNVRLPSGGEIVIDHSEALISIDVNSAQSTKGERIEETALNTNLEAAQEIARQLRIRDLGGLFVIDFIDMDEDSNNRKVEEALRDALKADRARVQISYISRFGLLEMSRQRLRSALNEATQVVCPRCHGQGSIRNIKSEALTILRLIEETALKENTKQIQAQVPINIATYLMNEQRSAIQRIEALHQLNVIIVPNPYMETPQHEIQAIGPNEKFTRRGKTLSYELIRAPMIEYQPKKDSTAEKFEKKEPAIKDFLPSTPAPKAKKGKKSGWFKRMLIALFSEEKTKKKHTKKHGKYHPTGKRYQQKGGRYSNRRHPSSSRGGYQQRGGSKRGGYRGGSSSRSISSRNTTTSRQEKSTTRHPEKPKLDAPKSMEQVPKATRTTRTTRTTRQSVKKTPRATTPPPNLVQVETKSKD